MYRVYDIIVLLDYPSLRDLPSFLSEVHSIIVCCGFCLFICLFIFILGSLHLLAAHNEECCCV